MNLEDVAAAVAGGLSIVCASCNKYWLARERGVPGSQCMSVSSCGSPLKGDDFHDYAGPLSEERMADWCFVCGSESTHAIRVRGKDRLIGICGGHFEYLATLRPLSKPFDAPPLLVRDGKTEVAVHKLFRPPKNSLARSIYEVEKYYADKEGREL